MSLRSLYDTISEQNTNTYVDDLPPIADTDVNQYANVLAKKSHLNENKSLIRENISTPVAAPRPAAAPVSNASTITTTFQQIQKKFNTATNQEKTLMIKILNSLT
jgi:hypothetical protein